MRGFVNWRGWAYRRLVLRDRAREYDAALRVITGFRPGDEGVLLDALIRHARDRVPFYRDEPAYAGVSSATFSSAPLLTRATVREEESRLTSTDASARGAQHRFTTGSTGEPLGFLVDREAAVWQRAVDDRYLADYLGLDPLATRRVVLWAYPGKAATWNRRQQISHLLTRSRVVNISRGLHPVEVCDLLAGYRPALLKGYAHSLFVLARAFRDSRLRPPRIPFVVTTAERLTAAMRAEMAEVFGADVRSLYGTREHGPMAGECGHGRMHVFPFANRVEVVRDDGRPVEPGSTGRVAVTGLHNHSMPLLRYVLGDQAQAGGVEPCPCGRANPVLGEVCGRMGEHIVRPDGVLMDYESYIQKLEREPWVREFRLEQHTVDEFSIVFTSGTDCPPEAPAAYAELFSRLQGVPCRVAFHRVDEIPRGRGGKHAYVRSAVFERMNRDWYDVVS